MLQGGLSKVLKYLNVQKARRDFQNHPDSYSHLINRSCKSILSLSDLRTYIVVASPPAGYKVCDISCIKSASVILLHRDGGTAMRCLGE